MSSEPDAYGTDNVDVLSVGDIIYDKHIDLAAVPADTKAEWEQTAWLPGPGESALADTVPDEIEEYTTNTLPGGRGPNQALAASYAGAETAFAGKAAREDEFDHLTGAGIDASAAIYDAAKEPSTAYVFTEPDGENRISFVRGEGASLSDSELSGMLTAAPETSYALISNGEPDATISQVLDYCAAEGIEAVFDPAPADGAEQFLDHPAVSYVTPNEEEYAALKDALDEVNGTVIRTNADGVRVETQHQPPEHSGYVAAGALNETYTVDAPDVEAVDTTGAGDTFNGYLAAGLSQGRSEREAVTYATIAASLSVTRDGAQNMPRFAEVDAFLEG